MTYTESSQNTKTAMMDRGGRNSKIQGSGHIGMTIIPMTKKIHQIIIFYGKPRGQDSYQDQRECAGAGVAFCAGQG